MENSLPKISAIITTYNSQKSIQRVLDCIKKQEGIHAEFEIELVIVDDCSTDETVSIIKSNGLDYISTGANSGGPNKGRNIGLKKASGDYICIVDHDDEWFSEKIISMLPYLNMAPIITSGFTVIDTTIGKESVITNQPKNNEGYIFYQKNETFLTKLRRSEVGQNNYLGSVIYSNKLQHLLFEETYGMVDLDWGFKLFHQQTSIEVCKSLYLRKIDGNNLSFNERYRLIDYDFSINFLESTYKNEYPEEVDISIKKINGSMARYYYMIENMSKARHYFLKSGINFKTGLYFLTSFFGYRIIKKHFNIFG